MNLRARLCARAQDPRSLIGRLFTPDGPALGGQVLSRARLEGCAVGSGAEIDPVSISHYLCGLWQVIITPQNLNFSFVK